MVYEVKVKTLLVNDNYTKCKNLSYLCISVHADFKWNKSNSVDFHLILLKALFLFMIQ